MKTAGSDETFGDYDKKQVQDHKSGAERAKTLAFGKAGAAFSNPTHMMFHGMLYRRETD